jgi:hypothetical protein
MIEELTGPSSVHISVEGMEKVGAILTFVSAAVIAF